MTTIVYYNTAVEMLTTLTDSWDGLSYGSVRSLIILQICTSLAQVSEFASPLTTIVVYILDGFKKIFILALHIIRQALMHSFIKNGRAFVKFTLLQQYISKV